MPHIIPASLTRIAHIDDCQYEVLGRDQWAWGDYVVGEVIEHPSESALIELTSGRLASVDVNDYVVGAFANRFATLEATGSWEEIGGDGMMSSLTSAGLFGVITSQSPYGLEHVKLRYRGHLTKGGCKLIMEDFSIGSDTPFNIPVILIVGSSMSSGKTRSAGIIIRRLKAMGLKVVGSKLTGAGRYRDILTMKDAGADAIFDFVDAGMPSTVCGEALFRVAARRLLGCIADTGADVVVVESGASPIEPYNGQTLAELLAPHMCMMLLCASDPYSVVGVVNAFGGRPDLVAGIACNTNAGRELIDRLTGLPTQRLIDPDSYPALDQILRRQLHI